VSQLVRIDIDLPDVARDFRAELDVRTQRPRGSLGPAAGFNHCSTIVNVL